MTLVGKVDYDLRAEVLKNKKSNEYLLSVSSYRDGAKQIEAHNLAINPKAKKDSRVITSSSQSIERKAWDWSKVSAKNKSLLESLYADREYRKIFKIHNELKLTDENYCCDGYNVKVDYNMEKHLGNGVV